MRYDAVCQCLNRWVFFVPSVVFQLALQFLPTSASAYYGRNSTEAKLEYTGYVDWVSPFQTVTLKQLQNERSPVYRAAKAHVEAQFQHLMGSFQSASFLDQFPFQGVLGESASLRFFRPELLFVPENASSDAPTWRLHYTYRGKVVFDKRAFRSQSERTLPIVLPRDPEAIYALGVRGGVNRCTDSHYNSESDFWYFWDPKMPGCPLAQSTAEVLTFSGSLRELPNTKRTYPEYDRLYGDNRNGRTLRASVFLGYIDDLPNLRVPRRRDDGYGALRNVENELKDLGFELAEKQDAFRIRSDGSQMAGINFRRIYTKEVERLSGNRGAGQSVEVELLLADTSIASRDSTFHHYLVPALRQSDMLVYDGHSGLGGNLDLEQIRGERLDPAKYQIFYFNGCSSYPYFKQMFIDAKGGTQSLEVITSGLPTLTDTAGPNVIAFLRPLLEGRTWSYQRLLAALENSNGENGTYLTGVSGDEDNQYEPKRGDGED
jgi:hypothetical protein